METEFSRRIAITGELAVGSSKILFFKGKLRPTFKWLPMGNFTRPVAPRCVS